MELQNVPEYLPLEQAAQQYAVMPEVLCQAVTEGIVQAVQAGDQVLVLVDDVQLLAVQVQPPDENDELVSISEVARRLKISPGTVFQWYQYGWLPQMATGPRSARLVSWTRAQALGRLHQERSLSGQRLIPRAKDILRV